MKSCMLLAPPTGELRKKILKELNEDEGRKDQDLAIIKDWLAKQPHLPNEWEDTCLLCFLRGCSFSLEKTKRKLDMYFTMRTLCPEFFQNRDITRPELVHFVSKAIAITMPGLTPNGRRVSIIRGPENFTTSELIDCYKIAMMIGDVRLCEETEPIAGDVYILDASVITPSQIGNISNAVVKKFMICVQETYPVKIKEIHIINTSPVIEVILTLIKNIMSDKIKKRIYLHKDHTTLHEYIPKDLLPEEFGGTGPSIKELQKLWVEKLKEKTDWFKKQEAIKSNEALRPGKPMNSDELFGIEGSFRQLAID